MNKVLKKIDYKELIMVFVVALITFLCTCLYLTSPLSKTFPWNDSSGFLYDGKALLSGQTMYVDFFDHKGPLIFVINALGLLIGGLKGVWLLDFISAFVFLFFSYKTVKMLSNKIIGLISVVALSMFMPYYLDIGNFTETFSLGFIGLSLYLFSKYFYDNKKQMSIMSSLILGLSFMGCLLLRPNVAVLWVVFCPVVFFQLIFCKKIKEAFKILLYFFVGCFIMFLPFAIYFTITNAWHEFFYQCILLNFVYIDSGGGFFSPRVLDCLKFFLNTPAFCISLLPLILLFFPKIFKKIYNNKLLYFISIYVLLILTSLSITMSGFQFPHYGIILLPCFVICFGFFLTAIWYFIKNNNKNYVVKGLLIILLGATIYVVSIYDNNYYHYMKERTWIVTNADTRPELEGLSNFIKNNTNKKDDIMIFGSLPELYLVADRMSSSKYSYQNYWTFASQTKIVNQVIADIDDEKTKALVLVDKGAYESYPDIAKRVQVILDKEYKLSLSDYGVLVYLRK